MTYLSNSGVEIIEPSVRALMGDIGSTVVVVKLEYLMLSIVDLRSTRGELVESKTCNRNN